MSALSHGFYHTCWYRLRATRWLPVPDENRRSSLGGCDCGGEVVVLDFEAVSPRGVVDRRVLTADVDAGLGLITCVRR